MATTKKKPGRWTTGQSGNPKGRPPGVGKVAKLRNSIEKHVPEIIKTLVVAAKAGDAQAARLLLDRALPTLKPAELPQVVSLGDGTLTDQGRAVLAAVATGMLAPGQGAVLLSAIGALARVLDIDELESRVAALEKQSIPTTSDN